MEEAQNSVLQVGAEEHRMVIVSHRSAGGTAGDLRAIYIKRLQFARVIKGVPEVIPLAGDDVCSRRKERSEPAVVANGADDGTVLKRQAVGIKCGIVAQRLDQNNSNAVCGEEFPPVFSECLADEGAADERGGAAACLSTGVPNPRVGSAGTGATPAYVVTR